MKKVIAYMLPVLLPVLLAACGNAPQPSAAESAAAPAEFVQITQAEAKTLMDSEADPVILDVRSQEEYDSGHIPGAIVIPDTEVAQKATEQLPDKAQLILVYCRSGRRSKLAAAALAELGYTNVKEFGGINDWPYEITK